MFCNCRCTCLMSVCCALIFFSASEESFSWLLYDAEFDPQMRRREACHRGRLALVVAVMLLVACLCVLMKRVSIGTVDEYCCVDLRVRYCRCW